MATFAAQIHNFTEARRAFAALALKHTRTRGNAMPLGYATSLVRIDASTYAIRQHDTDVVTYREDGRIVLDTDGWVTTTTRDRLDEFTPRDVRVIGRDILARRADADPRLLVEVARRDSYTGDLDWTDVETVATIRPASGPVTLWQTTAGTREVPRGVVWDAAA